MITPSFDSSAKITAQHLERAAYVYVRQSSMRQVEEHLESQRRQYDLARWAGDIGWPKDRILTVDEDQAKSGANPGTRAGFGRLVTAVGRSEVGVVFSLEVSRLARNSPDWHHLMYLCRWTNTLIADEHGIYDLSVSADRMLLGLRGQFAEMELDTSIHRMVEARWSKARRGEFFTIPPAGYELDDRDQLIMTPDEAVQTAIRTVFSKFEELGSARQVFVWWRENGMKFPVRRVHRRTRPVVWAVPAYRNVRTVLIHPIYSGAYAFGRSETVREIDLSEPGRPRVKKRRRQRESKESWPVLIHDHHPGYVSFEKYLEIQERIRGNAMMECKSAGNGPAREGRALLQGIVRCGRCGRNMIVSYGGRRGSETATRTMQYRCLQARRNEVAGADCQLVGGKQIDRVVVQAFLQATSPAGVEAAVRADEQMRQESEAVERHWALQIEKATYEAQRAERQYHAAEPENRLVARELERRWNESLTALESVRAQAEAARAHRRPLTAEESVRAQQLGAHLEAVWDAETTTNRDKKRLLRCAIEEVQLRTEDKRYHVRIVWKGGLATDHEAPRHRRGQWNVTPEDTVDLVRKLACEFDDAQIARILNKQGRRAGAGVPFTQAIVAKLRRQHGMTACGKKSPRDPREGPFNADEAGVQLGVATETVHRWLREGVLPGRQATPGAPWRIVLTEDLRRRLGGGDAPEGWVGLSEAAQRLGLGKSNVAHLVKTGKLRAVRTKVGKRTCWRIDVSSRTYARQAELFDQMTIAEGEES